MEKNLSSLETFLDKRKKAEDKAAVNSLPLFKHANEVERERQLAEQREITQNATGEDILDSSPKKTKKETRNQAGKETPKQKIIITQTPTNTSWEGLYPPDEDDVYKGPR